MLNDVDGIALADLAFAAISGRYWNWSSFEPFRAMVLTATTA